MTKKISDEELANVSGAGEAAVTNDTPLSDTVSKKGGSGTGGPAEAPDTSVPGNDPADLDRD